MKPLLLAAATGFATLSASHPALAVCYHLYRPVCAFTTGEKAVTVPNACEARENGDRILHGGRCAATGNHCPQLRIPVCAVDSETGRQRTFKNLCFSELAGATLSHSGPCN